MAEMVEKVARALFEGSIYHGYDDETKVSEWMRTRGIHRAQARRAIQALREPSDAVIDAMEDAMRGIGIPVEPADTRVVINSMIDAILAEGGER